MSSILKLTLSRGLRRQNGQKSHRQHQPVLQDMIKHQNHHIYVLISQYTEPNIPVIGARLELGVLE